MIDIDPAVGTIFDSWDNDAKRMGLDIRSLIYALSEKLPEVGPIFETTKWNQPAYLTQETKAGSTIRIDILKATGQLGIFVHCQTNLIDTFRHHYGDVLNFQKNRAILLDTHKAMPQKAVEHCLAMALTYHLNKHKSLVGG